MPFKDECGVFGIFGHPEAANLTYLGLYALQHRGQESAGISSADGEKLRISRAMGQVAEAFNEQTLQTLPGHIAVGHTRYSTAGESKLENAQPFLIDCAHGQIAVAHNGNLVNAMELRDELVRNGSIFQTSSDTEVILHLYARSRAASVEDAHQRVDCAGPRRVLARPADQEPAHRRERPSRIPPARARAPRRCLDRLLRDVRARPDRRHIRARRRAGRAARHQRRRTALDQAVPAAAALALRVRARLLRQAGQLRLRPQRERSAHRSRAHPGPRSARRRRRRSADSRLRRLRRDRVRGRGWPCR